LSPKRPHSLGSPRPCGLPPGWAAWAGVCPKGRHGLRSGPAHSLRVTLQRPFSTPLHQPAPSNRAPIPPIVFAPARPLKQGPHSAYSPAREACFFGNLFTNEGLFFGVDRLIDHNAYLTRACAGMSGSGNGAGSCAPLTFVGGCALNCLQLIPELGGPFHRACTYNGKSYRAITTRMRESDYEQFFAEP